MKFSNLKFADDKHGLNKEESDHNGRWAQAFWWLWSTDGTQIWKQSPKHWLSTL